MQVQYPEYKKLNELWDKIEVDFEKMVKLDDQHELEKLVFCNLESYSSVAEWISAQDAIVGGRTVLGRLQLVHAHTVVSRTWWLATSRLSLDQVSWSPSCP